MEVYYTRRYEDAYGLDVIDEVFLLFGADAMGEIFWSMWGHIETLCVELEIYTWEAEWRLNNDWDLQKVLAAADETALFARRQRSPAWLQISFLAALMRLMVKTAVQAPASENEAEEDRVLRRDAVMKRIVSGSKSPMHLVVNLGQCLLGDDEVDPDLSPCEEGMIDISGSNTTIRIGEREEIVLDNVTDASGDEEYVDITDKDKKVELLP